MEEEPFWHIPSQEASDSCPGVVLSLMMGPVPRVANESGLMTHVESWLSVLGKCPSFSTVARLFLFCIPPLIFLLRLLIEVGTQLVRSGLDAQRPTTGCNGMYWFAWGLRLFSFKSNEHLVLRH